MKKFLAKASVAFLIVAGSVGLGATAASATELPVCTPSDAWTEVIPDVEHPAETHTVEHDAVYKTVEVSPAVPEVLEVSHLEYQWKWWGYHNHGQTVWTDGSYPTEAPNQWAGEWKKNGKERKVIDQAYIPAKPAVTEQRLVTEARTEIVVDKEAWTEVIADIEHPAVECPEEPVVVAPSIAGTSWSGTCDANFGGFSYDVTVGSENGDRAFQVKSLGDGTGGTAELFYNEDGTTGAPGEIIVFTTVAAGESATLSLSNLAPGNYRVVSDGSQKVKANYVFNFTVVDAGECPIVVVPPVDEEPSPTPEVPETEVVDTTPATVTTSVVAEEETETVEATELAETGSQEASVLGYAPWAIAAMLMVLGAAILFGRRVISRKN